MIVNTNKKHNNYHELDNNEEVEFIEIGNKLERKNSDIKSAELPPKFHHKNSESTAEEPDSNKDLFKHSISTERITALRKFNSFSPKSYKRTLIGEVGTKEQLIALDNNIKEINGLLNEKGKINLEKLIISEKNLIEKLKNNLNIIDKNEEIMNRLKHLFEILQKKNFEERSSGHEILKEIIAKTLENNMNKDIAAMLTGDSVIEREQNDNMNALRESFHEFSLKKLMQMSFVEKRKALNLIKNENPLSVETNYIIKKPGLNPSNSNANTNYDDDESICFILYRNIWILICAALISALICVILVM